MPGEGAYYGEMADVALANTDITSTSPLPLLPSSLSSELDSNRVWHAAVTDKHHYHACHPGLTLTLRLSLPRRLA